MMCALMCRGTASGDVRERGCCDATECCRGVQTTQEAQAVHSLPDDDLGAGVRQQLVHNASETLGNRLQASSHRATGQSLVSEPANEAQEAQRARQANDIPRRGFVLPTVDIVAFIDVIAFCAPPDIAMASCGVNRRVVTSSRKNLMVCR